MTFKNEQTLEYQFFYVQFKATPPGVISAIDLSTPVRQSNSGMINVSNPLQIPVTFQLSCNVQDVSFPPQRTVPPQSEVSIFIQYIASSPCTTVYSRGNKFMGHVLSVFFLIHDTFTFYKVSHAVVYDCLRSFITQ